MKFRKNEDTVCAEMPDAFWHRKKYWVSLPYKKNIDEENIPSTNQAVPMDERMRSYCK